MVVSLTDPSQGMPSNVAAAITTGFWQEDAVVRRASHNSKPSLKCRLMVDRDIESAVSLLSSGFPERTPRYWRCALRSLRDRSLPEGFPRYGYVIAEGDRLVGIVLIIFAKTDSGSVRGNVSSWYVEPGFRGFSNLLLSAPLKLKDTTLFNISPAPNTLETIRAQGFSKYVGGTYQALAAIAPPVAGAKLRRIEPGAHESNPILSDHARWNCLSFEISYRGERYPFVFAPSRFIADKLPCAQLVYCRDVGDFVRFAGPLGRRLLRHGLFAVMIDSDDAIRNLPGVYRAGRGSRFYSGGERPRIGDLSYTELAIFGA